MSYRFIVFLVIAGIILSSSACTGVTTPLTAEKTDDISVTKSPRYTELIDVCEPSTIPNIAFPRQEPVEGPREVMEAELVGVLVLERGCLRVDSLYNDGSYLPVWPPEFSLDLDGDTVMIVDGDDVVLDGLVEIIDGNGALVAQEGGDLILHGGPIPHSWDSEHYRQLYFEIPGDCFGPYWIVGE